MNIEIKRLTAELMYDDIYIFENSVFSDNKDWEGCYCVSYHWDEWR